MKVGGEDQVCGPGRKTLGGEGADQAGKNGKFRE
jgi:hypothetical protein